MEAGTVQTGTVETVRGFTAGEAVKRLVEKAGKAQVSWLALVAMAKMKGWTNKRVRDAFGDKCPSWISGTFRYADNFVAAALSPNVIAEIGNLTVAEAEKETVRRIGAHMAALKVTSFEAYKKVCQHAEWNATVDAILNPPAEEPAAPAEETAPTTGEAPAEEPAAPVGDPLETLVAGLSDDDLTRLAGLVHAEMIRRTEPVALAA